MSDQTTWLYPKSGEFMLNTNRNLLTQPFAFDMLLQHFTRTSTGKNLALILFAQNWSHYSAVATKCGLNLRPHQADGRIEIIDTFEHEHFDWIHFKRDVFDCVSRLPPNSAFLIDDLSVLLSLEISPIEIYMFIRKLRTKLCGGEKRCSLFVASYRSASPAEDESLDSLLISLAYECDTWLDCDQPQSGYSRQINGIARCRNMLANESSGSTIEMNYKFSNRTVHFKRI